MSSGARGCISPALDLSRTGTEMCSGSEAGSYLRPIDSCITQLKAQRPSGTCNESKEEEEDEEASGIQKNLNPREYRKRWTSIGAPGCISPALDLPGASRLCIQHLQDLHHLRESLHQLQDRPDAQTCVKHKQLLREAPRTSWFESLRLGTTQHPSGVGLHMACCPWPR